MDGGRHQRKWFLLASLLLTLAGAATCGALPVETAAEDAAARPAEGMEFPNTGFIPGDLTEQLNIDEFFSLWFVFLDDDVFTSDKEFTILAPSNAAPMRPSPVSADKDRVRQLLLNHIVLGRAMSVEELAKSKSPLTLTTLGGGQLHFKHRKDGAVVNGVKIIQKEVKVPHGVILVLEDYLFMDQYHGDIESSASQFSAIPMITSSSDDFPMIELGTHNQQDSESHVPPEMVKPENIGAVLANRQKLSPSNVSRPFFDELMEVLNFLRSGTSDFRRYLEQVNISDRFLPDQEYTAFIPMDDSFAQWYPIDWGFNPFDVDSFVHETILNHFVPGRHKQSSFKEGDVLTTLGGKKLKFTSQGKMAVNGVEIFVGDTPVSRGNIQFIGDLLFVDAAVVKELNAKHRDVESAPLIISPWYSSQFLSHIYRELSGRHQFNFILDYINRTQPTLKDDLPSHDESRKMMSYTFFAPRDSAFFNLWPQDTADPFVIDDEFRREILLNHFVRHRLYHDQDLVDGAQLTMAGNKTAKITREGNVTKINDAVIQESDIFIYNLGTVFVVDRVLFASQERIGQVLTKHADTIPSFGAGHQVVGTAKPVVVEDTSTVVVDLVAELLEASTTSRPLGSLVIKT